MENENFIIRFPQSHSLSHLEWMYRFLTRTGINSNQTLIDTINVRMYMAYLSAQAGDAEMEDYWIQSTTIYLLSLKKNGNIKLKEFKHGSWS